MALVFFRPGFKTGVCVLKWDDGASGVASQAFRPWHNGVSFALANEPAAAAKYPSWLMSAEAYTAKLAERADDIANGRSPEF